MTSTWSSTRPTLRMDSASRLRAPRPRMEPGSASGSARFPVGRPPHSRCRRAGSPTDDQPALRAPRYAPTGGAIAFVDLRGWVAILGDDDEPSSRARFEATRPPIWLPDAAALVLTGRPSTTSREPAAFEAPVHPLAAGATGGILLLERTASTARPSGLGPGAAVLAVGPDGEIAYRAGDGTLRVTPDLDVPGDSVGIGELGVLGATFAPGERSMAVVVPRGSRDHPLDGAIVRIGRDGTGRDVLSNDGRQPRWLP